MRSAIVWWEGGTLVSDFGPVYSSPTFTQIAGPATRDAAGEWTVGLFVYATEEFKPSHLFGRTLFNLLPLEPSDGYLSIHKYEDAGDWYIRIEQGCDDWGRKSWTYRIYETKGRYLGVWPD